MSSGSVSILPIVGGPSFLSLSAWRAGEQVFELVSRRRLDTRQVLPYFVEGGVTYAGLLERTRASRALRSAELAGYEPIGIDFARVDETGDILHYGQAIFTERARVVLDEQRLTVPLPSYARSVGYLTEASLPLLVPIEPPGRADIDVAWDGGEHRVRFASVAEWGRRLGEREAPWSEDLALMLAALDPAALPDRPSLERRATPDAARWLGRQGERVWTAARLAALVEEGQGASPRRASYQRLPEPRAEQLAFLKLYQVELAGQRWEVLRPGSGASLALLPYVVDDGEAYFLLWCEDRLSVLERRVRQPLHDAPAVLPFVNAMAYFLKEADAALVGPRGEVPPELAESLLCRALGRARVARVEPLGPWAEPSPSVSSELRVRAAVELDPASLGALPPEVFVIPARELARAVGEGLVRDPVVAGAMAQLGGMLGVDPFRDARSGEPPRRRAFLDAMTQGSIVQRRLQRYSSIEAEQLGAPTYARLMTYLQHEFGVRVAYPRTEADRSFFKAAFRVFMAADRGEDRALQGLHWSHDAFHFALGNFTLPPAAGFARWYVAGEAPPPEAQPEGLEFERYASALKTAEDEATFFSFWTLFHEQPSLARHVSQLTFWKALCEMGIEDRARARAIFDDVTTRERLPPEVEASEAYRARPEVRSLFTYMLGFREYHLKDIRAAYRFASRDVYRGFFLRYDIYEHDLERYLSQVRGFQARLDAYPPGLSPLLCACADARVAHSLRVWDVVKALKLVRQASLAMPDGSGEARRASFLEVAEGVLRKLDAQRSSLDLLRARVKSAEIVPRNEALFEAIAALSARLEALRGEVWDAASATGLLSAGQIAEERARELPR